MASNKPKPCGPCKERKVETKACIWCYNCNEGLCSTCYGHHKRSKSLRDHQTIDIKCNKPYIQAIKTECDKHGQQLNLYCPSHLIPCCDKCILTSHSKCTGIKSLASVIEKTKMEKSKESLDKDINSILDILNKMVTNKTGNIKRGEQQCASIRGRILKFRKKINAHLDRLQKKLCQEAETILNKEKQKASDLINEIEEERGKLDGMKVYLHSVTSHSSKLQSFLGVNQIGRQIHQCQQYVDELEGDGRTKEFDIKMKQNDELENIFSKLGSLNSLGEILVDKTDMSVNIRTSVRRKAQVQSQEQFNINNMTIDIKTKRKVHNCFLLSNVICQMNGRLIVVEQYGTVKPLTYNGKLQKHFPISGQAWGVTQITQDTLAVAYPKEKAIKIFNMENETVTKLIKLDKECHGLCFSNDSLSLGLDADEIRIIDLEGNTLKSIQVKKSTSLYCLVSCHDRVFYCDYFEKTVYCYDGSGKQIWKYKQDLSGPVGLCADTYGNIIVADHGRQLRIIAISKNGQSSKVVFNTEDGMKTPQCICFGNNELSCFITDFFGAQLIVFNISYE